MKARSTRSDERKRVTNTLDAPISLTVSAHPVNTSLMIRSRKLEEGGNFEMSQLSRFSIIALTGLGLLLFSIFFVPALARAQAVSGAVLGTVTDASGAAVANATVTLTDIATSSARQSQTNNSGNYAFPNVPQGT